MGHSLQVGFIVAIHIGRHNFFHFKRKAVLRLHIKVSRVAQEGIFFLQTVEIHSHTEGKLSRFAVVFAMGNQPFFVAAFAASAGIVAPHRNEFGIQGGVRLIEAIGVHRARKVEEIVELRVACHAVDGRRIRNDNHIERSQPFVGEWLTIVGVVLPVEVAMQLVHDDRFAFVACENRRGKAVFFVENLLYTHPGGVFGRINEVGHEHRHIARALCLKNFVENHLKVGVGSIAHPLGRGINVAVLQETVHRALVGVDVGVHDIDSGLVARGEEIDEVVHRFLQLPAARCLVVGHHRPAPLKIDAQAQTLVAIFENVPLHRRPQILPHFVDHFLQGFGVDAAIGIHVIAIFFSILRHDLANGLVGLFGGVAFNECVLHRLVKCILATTAQHHRHTQQCKAKQRSKTESFLHHFQSIYQINQQIYTLSAKPHASRR